MIRNFSFFAGLLIILYALYQFSELETVFLGLTGLVILLLCAIDLVQALGLLLFAIAISPEIQAGGIPIRIEDLILPVILFFWVLNLGIERGRLKPTNMRLPLFAFLFFMLISTVNAIIVNTELNQLVAFFHFLKHVEYVLIFLVAFNVVETTEDLQFLCYCLIGAAAVLALHASLPFLSILDAGGAEAPERLHGVATETANIFGGYLVFHILFATAFLLEEDSTTLQIGLILGITLMIYPLLFTFSRSSYVGFVAGFLFLGLFHKPRILVGGSLVTLSLFTIVPTNVIQRFGSIFVALSNAELASSWNARLDAWIQYLPVIVKNPFIGKGLFFIAPGDVDNEIVLRLVQTGIFGVLAFIWVFASFYSRARVLWMSDNTIYKKIGVGYITGLVGLAFHSLAATSFTAIRTAEPLYFASGLVLAGYLMYLNIGPQHTSVELKQKEEQNQLRRKRHTARPAEKGLAP